MGIDSIEIVGLIAVRL